MLKNDIKEIIDSKNILKSLVIKNLVGRYKNSVLGFGWHFVIPIMMMLIYYIVFTQIRQNSIPNFWIFISSAIFPFTFMVSNLTGGCGCIVSNAAIVKKIYFPRLLIVLAQVISTFIVLIVGYTMVILATAITGSMVNYSALVLPAIIILMLFFVTGYTLALSAITVYIRDVQYFLNSISVAFFFVTPMYFMASETTGLLNSIIWINPFTYYIESVHQILYFGQMPTITNLLICSALGVLTPIVGYIIFKKLEKGFVERL